MKIPLHEEPDEPSFKDKPSPDDYDYSKEQDRYSRAQTETIAVFYFCHKCGLTFAWPHIRGDHDKLVSRFVVTVKYQRYLGSRPKVTTGRKESSGNREE